MATGIVRGQAGGRYPYAWRTTLGVLALIAAMPTGSAADTIIYGSNRDGQMVEINLTQDTSRFAGTLTVGTQAMEQDPATGYVYYFDWGSDADQFLYWDPSTGTNTLVRQYSPPPGIYPKRLAFHPDGTLYLMDTQDRLFTVDKSNGNVTALGPVNGLEDGPQGGTGDFAFAPDGTLYVVTYQNLYTLDIPTRTPKLLYADLIPDGPGINVFTGLAYCNGLLYASDIQESALGSAIQRIDPSTGAISQLFYAVTYLNDTTSCPAVDGPAAPSFLTAVAGGEGEIDLQWQDNSLDEDGFRIERRTSSPAFTVIATVDAGATTYLDQGLPPATTFTYRVSAYRGPSGSAYSNEASATTAGGAPSAAIDDVSVAEGDSGTRLATFTVTLAPPPTTTVTVNWSTADGTATSGSDYVAASGVLSFGPGVSTQAIAVAVDGDTVDEPDETFLVNLTGATGAVLADSQGVGTILDDDVAATGTLVYFSTAGNTAVPGVAGPYDDADVYLWDGSAFSRTFDASAAGLSSIADVDALKVVDADTFYLSFSGATASVPGLGTVQDEDVVRYDAGTWTLYFDGSAVGLADSSNEDVDAFEILADGSALVSTLQSASVPGVSGIQDEDLLRCVGTFGPGPTTCTWSLYFDGSALGLGSSSEDVDGVSVSSGRIYLSTLGSYSVAGLSGGGDEVFACESPSGSPAVSCAAGFTLAFDGGALGLSDGIDAFDVVAGSGGPANSPPSVDAGPGQAVTLPASAALDGTVGDDGLVAPLVTSWTQTSGPGTTTFGNAAAVDTTAAFSAAGTYVLRLTADDGELVAFDEVTIAVTPAATGGMLLYLSTAGDTAVPGVTGPYDDADIYLWDESAFSRIFDASAAGLSSSADVDALKVVDADTFYVSFSTPTGVPGVGTVQDEDVVRYDAGTWTLYFDGSAVGLADSDNEDVDAFEILADGSVLVSTLQSASVPGVSGVQDEDLLRCAGTFGPGGTTCTWSLYLDGSALGLANAATEDVDGASVSASRVYLSTLGSYAVAGLSGGGDEVFACESPSGSPVVSCAGVLTRVFDASALGVNDGIDAFDVVGGP